MKIFLESNIVKEKRDFLKENDIVFEILTIVKKVIDTYKKYLDNYVDDLYDPYDAELYASYKIKSNVKASILKNEIRIEIKKLKSFTDFESIFIIYYVTDDKDFTGTHSSSFRNFFDTVEKPIFKIKIGVPEKNDIIELIFLLADFLNEDGKETLVHEIEHMLQDIRTNFHEYPYHNGDDGRDKYFNQTSEIEANVAGVLRAYINQLRGFLKKLIPNGKISPSEMRELIQNHWQITFDTFSGNSYEKILEIPNKYNIINKKVIKRFLNFAKKEIKKAYIQTIQSFIK